MTARKKRKSFADKPARAVCIAMFILVVYVVMSWQRFSIAHPKAGNGAFYVHFWEVVTWDDVEDLK
jgi:hypothetical protein